MWVRPHRHGAASTLMTMTINRGIAGAVLLCAALIPAGANASPTDPDADDWVSIALSPQLGSAAFGAAGSRDRAMQIAMDECTQRANGTRCVTVQATEYGCVAFVLDKASRSWAGGVGSDKLSAGRDAVSRLAASGYLYSGDTGLAGVQCSSPVTRP